MSQLDQAKIADVLEQILTWLKLLGSDQANKLLSKILDTDAKKIAYQLSDGKTNTIYLASCTKLSQARISQLWKEWTASGIGQPISAKGGSRFRRAFDLVSLGILPSSSLPKQFQASDNEDRPSLIESA